MEYGLVVVWVLVFAALGTAGLPLAARLFPRAAGRGAGFALPLALAVVTLVGYWVGHLAYPVPALVAGLVVLGGLAALAALDPDALRDGNVVVSPSLDVDRAAVRDVAAVFLVAFAFLLAVRAVDPAVSPGAGEKFLDFGLLKSLARAGQLPPEDIWFAGEPVRYYYGGHLASHLLATLSGTPPRFAYNLALAGFYAMLVSAAFDLAGTVAAAQGRSRRLAGLTAAFFVGVAANLSTGARLVAGVLPDSLVAAVAARVGVAPDAATVTPASFSYWTASRIIDGTANEFPLFAWLNGDLHAHMMGTPFFLLAVALAYAYYRAPATERRRRLALALGVVPLLASLGAVVNTWSFPSVFGVLWLAATFAPADAVSLLPRGVATTVRQRVRGVLGPADEELLRPVSALVIAGTAGAFAVVLAFPFFTGAVGGGREVALLPAADRTGLGALLVVHGAFVLPFADYLWEELEADRPVVLLAGVAAVGFAAGAVSLPAALLTVPLVVVGWAGLRARRRVGFETVLVIAGAGLVTAVEVVYLSEQAAPGRFNTVFKTYAQVWVLWATALGVVLPALVVRRPQADPVGTGSGAVATADGGAEEGAGGDAREPVSAGEAQREATAESPPRVETATSPGPTGAAGETATGTSTGRRVRPVALALVVLLVVATGAYGALAVGAHFDRTSGPATLDALAFVGEFHPESAAAIEWVDAREGQPTLVSAPATGWKAGEGWGHPPGMYRWTSSPAASLTGVSTVAGWQHEVGYRGADPYYARVADVDTIYTGRPAEQARLLRTYDVEYVWVGAAERARYGSGAVTVTGLPGVSLAHESGNVQVYAVDRDRLPGAEAGRSGLDG
jgi:YYY domain-containing protein